MKENWLCDLSWWSGLMFFNRSLIWVYWEHPTMMDFVDYLSFLAHPSQNLFWGKFICCCCCRHLRHVIIMTTLLEPLSQIQWKYKTAIGKRNWFSVNIKKTGPNLRQNLARNILGWMKFKFFQMEDYAFFPRIILMI